MVIVMVRTRGRPVKSKVRDNILVILSKLGPLYGYEIYKLYKKNFGSINIRSIYYNLKKGEELGILKCKNEEKRAKYGWGDNSIVKKYSLIKSFKTNVEIKI